MGVTENAKKLIKVELHIHTRYSHDSILALPILLLMCKLKKIDCIGIADHNAISGALAATPYFNKHGIDVIVGEEIFTQSGEIIGWFLSDNIPAGLSVSETISQIHLQGGLVCVPHPYDNRRKKTVLHYQSILEFRKEIDLIECHNGRNRGLETSEKQDMIADAAAVRKIIGSDAHTFFEIGRNFIVMPEFQSPQNFLDSLNSAQFTKKNCQRMAHFVTKIIRIWILIIKGGWYELLDAFSRRIRKKKH